MCVFIHFIANHWPLKVVSSKGRVYTSDALVHNSIKCAFWNNFNLKLPIQYCSVFKRVMYAIAANLSKIILKSKIKRFF